MECSICMGERARSPVVTRCGHLFCWPCTYTWLSTQQQQIQGGSCPVCKGVLSLHTGHNSFTPIYAAGALQDEAEDEEARYEAAGIKEAKIRIPPRPRAAHIRHIEAEPVRQQLDVEYEEDEFEDEEVQAEDEDEEAEAEDEETEYEDEEAESEDEETEAEDEEAEIGIHEAEPVREQVEYVGHNHTSVQVETDVVILPSETDIMPGTISIQLTEDTPAQSAQGRADDQEVQVEGAGTGEPPELAQGGRVEEEQSYPQDEDASRRHGIPDIAIRESLMRTQSEANPHRLPSNMTNEHHQYINEGRTSSSSSAAWGCPPPCVPYISSRQPSVPPPYVVFPQLGENSSYPWYMNQQYQNNESRRTCSTATSHGADYICPTVIAGHRPRFIYVHRPTIWP